MIIEIIKLIQLIQAGQQAKVPDSVTTAIVDKIEGTDEEKAVVVDELKKIDLSIFGDVINSVLGLLKKK
ncbi:MAG: hypothetical protein WDA13_03950 [Candidatus Shapirobacteria bacterium]